MWAFTRHGFFSCTCAELRSDAPADKNRDPRVAFRKQIDPNTIMIRARMRKHLENLIRVLREGDVELDKTPSPKDIVESPSNDYRFRILVSKQDFGSIMLFLADDVDYGNFKSEVASLEGRSLYEQALHKVWSVMNAIQTAMTGPGIYSAPSTADLRAPGHDEDEGELAPA